MRGPFSAVCAAILMIAGQVAHAQSSQPPAETWPARPIRFIVPYPPGGPLDTVARTLAEKLRESLGHPVLVENKSGAGGNIGADIVAKAPPDGYTIVMGAVATHAINPALYSKMPYDANRDFAPVTRIASVPNVLVMNPDVARKLGIDSLPALIDYARQHPGQLNFGSGGNGSAGHLAGELLKSMAGIAMVHIPYQGAVPAQLGLISGQTDLMFDNLASAAAQIRAGKLLALAVTTEQRSAFFPALPTVGESGLKGFNVDTWFGVFAPGGTPPAIVDRLNTELRHALASPELSDRLSALGASASPNTPAEFAAYVRAEQDKYARVVKISHASVD